jgi:hypothetical protein
LAVAALTLHDVSLDAVGAAVHVLQRVMTSAICGS